MIKKLIEDIAFDKISLSQGLTRAKLIANQIGNKTFNDWLTFELTGYKFNEVPNFRKIFSEVELIVEFPYGVIRNYPLILDNSFDKDLRDLVKYHRVIEPISIIEKNISEMKKGKYYVYLPSAGSQNMTKHFPEIEDNNGLIKKSRRQIGKNQLQNIIEVTKVKLIDTLQELHNQFPKIDENYVINDENIEKTQSIITTNIYGNNNPINMVNAENVIQENFTFSITSEEREKLETFGVSKKDVNELEEIDKKHPKGTSERKKKMMSWLGKVTASIASKGIVDQIPNLIEFIGRLY